MTDPSSSALRSACIHVFRGIANGSVQFTPVNGGRLQIRIRKSARARDLGLTSYVSVDDQYAFDCDACCLGFPRVLGEPEDLDPHDEKPDVIFRVCRGIACVLGASSNYRDHRSDRMIGAWSSEHMLCPGGQPRRPSYSPLGSEGVLAAVLTMQSSRYPIKEKHMPTL
jgi:hypothetical protein